MFSGNKSTKPALLMFIDDNESDITLIQKSFDRERVRSESEYYSNGNEALARLEDTTKPLPDMIFIDRILNSPIEGDDLVEFLRGKNKDRFSSCKIIVMSAVELTAADIKRFTELNVDVIFPKPLIVSNIIDMIRSSKDYSLQIMRELVLAA